MEFQSVRSNAKDVQDERDGDSLPAHLSTSTVTSRRSNKDSRSFLILLLTPFKMSYDATKEQAQPYTKTVEELPDMRRNTVKLVKKAVKEDRTAYVLVNNRSEGNVPLIIQALRNTLHVAET